MAFFQGLCRISTLKLSHFNAFDHGICTRKQYTHEPWSTFPTTWTNHIRTAPHRRSGTFIDLERWRTREATQSLLLRWALSSYFLKYFNAQSGDDVPSFIPPNASTHPIIMRKEMTWRSLLAYFRTWSALHTFHECFPEDKTSVEDTRFLEADLAIIESGAGADTSFPPSFFFFWYLTYWSYNNRWYAWWRYRHPILERPPWKRVERGSWCEGRGGGHCSGGMASGLDLDTESLNLASRGEYFSTTILFGEYGI